MRLIACGMRLLNTKNSSIPNLSRPAPWKRLETSRIYIEQSMQVNKIIDEVIDVFRPMGRAAKIS